mgnify:CR=1 FL=1
MDENNLSNQLNIAKGPLRRSFVGKIKQTHRQRHGKLLLKMKDCTVFNGYSFSVMLSNIQEVSNSWISTNSFEVKKENERVTVVASRCGRNLI